MSEDATVQERNQALARQINAEARANPNSPYAGKFVGIANGQVAVVTEDLDDLVHRLRAIEPDVTKTCLVEAGQNYDEEIEIWSLC
jgi:hypothetical protein